MRGWLKEYRLSKDLTQQDLADIVNIDVTSIGKYENGKRRPSYEVAKKIAEVLGFDWTEFFNEKVEV